MLSDNRRGQLSPSPHHPTAHPTPPSHPTLHHTTLTLPYPSIPIPPQPRRTSVLSCISSDPTQPHPTLATPSLLTPSLLTPPHPKPRQAAPSHPPPHTTPPHPSPLHPTSRLATPPNLILCFPTPPNPYPIPTSPTTPLPHPPHPTPLHYVLPLPIIMAGRRAPDASIFHSCEIARYPRRTHTRCPISGCSCPLCRRRANTVCKAD